MLSKAFVIPVSFFLPSEVGEFTPVQREGGAVKCVYGRDMWMFRNVCWKRYVMFRVEKEKRFFYFKKN